MYKKYVTFSYDDGLQQDKQLTALMRDFGLKGTFNINSGLFGKEQYVGYLGSLGFTEAPPEKAKDGLLKYVPQFRIPEDEIAQVYEGFEVASHGYRHEMLALSSRKVMEESIDLDLANLERVVGYKMKTFAYAKGFGSKAARAYLKENGIVSARGISSTKSFSFQDDDLLNFQPSASQIDKDLFEIIDNFLATDPVDDDMLLYIWGHGYECDYNTDRGSWERTIRMFEKLAGRDDLTYCTNIEAFEDHLARKANR